MKDVYEKIHEHIIGVIIIVFTLIWGYKFLFWTFQHI